MASDSSDINKNSVESFIGCFISLISKYEIRYEGVLYFLDPQDSTIGLKNVRSYGTEGRRKDGPHVPPSEKTYEYILFRGNDIKDLQVKSPSTSLKAEEPVLNDPAIIQSQYSGVLSSPVPSVGGRSLTESVQRHDTPAMISRALPVELPYHHSVELLGPLNQSSATQVASHPSFSTPMYWQGNNGISNSSYSLQQSSHIHPPSMVSPLTKQHWMQTPETQEPTEVGWTSLPDCGVPLSSISASSLVNPASSSPTSVQISDSLNSPALLSTKQPMLYSASMTSNGSNTSSFLPPFHDINSVEGQSFGKISPDPRPSHPGHSIHHSASSFVDSTSGPLLTPPSLLTPDQFAQPRPHFFSLTHNLTPNQKDMDALTLTPSSSSVLVPSPASQAPLLPSPNSVQKPQYSASQFTEEFDFEAMNEKFKKDEVWGSLGMVTEKVEAVEDYERCGLIPDSKPAYNKDDFFDSISCNSLSRGLRNGQNRFSERMKLDVETFGNFQQRPNFGYSGNGAGRGGNFRGSSYTWGRGYGYGGRGHGANLPF